MAPTANADSMIFTSISHLSFKICPPLVNLPAPPLLPDLDVVVVRLHTRGDLDRHGHEYGSLSFCHVAPFVPTGLQ